MNNLFIVLLLIVILAWDLPNESPFRIIVAPFRNTILFAGLWHSWKMFAPEPLHVNRRLIVRASSGREFVDLDWSDFTSMTRFEAFLRMRERKYQENLLSRDMPYLCEALTEHLLQWFAADGQYPKEVAIIREATNVADMRSAELAKTGRDTLFVWRRSDSEEPVDRPC